MEVLTTFVIYLGMFRLAIIAAGITSIVLGYKLFVRGIFPKPNRKEPAEGHKFEAEFAGAKFSLRNAAPGTCFALFGVILVVMMLLTGPPEVTLELLDKGMLKATLRGNSIEEIRFHSESAVNLVEGGNHIEAVYAANETLELLAGPLNNYAWVLLKANPTSVKTALLAELAVSIEPNHPDFLHTLAEVQFHKGDTKKAIETLEKAARIRPSFKRQLEEWRSKVSSN